jgi:hypothetical protein
MAIGNPINLTSNVESKNISVIATAGQTQFTVTGGYRINQISVFRNGVRLVDGRDFTALDGSIVTLLSAALVGDALEFQIFDDFRVADALSVNSGGTVNGNVTVTGILSTTNLSIGSSISLDATTGIITAVQVIGGTITGTATTAINAQGLIGTPDITVNNIVAAAGTFSGVLTYEDVTNIDSLGIVTARTGVDITANGLVVNAGVSTFAANLSIADKIIHTGDSNTAIRFPSPDTFTVETAGTERLRVKSDGVVAISTGLQIVGGGLTVTGVSTFYNNVDMNGVLQFEGSGTGRILFDADSYSGSSAPLTFWVGNSGGGQYATIGPSNAGELQIHNTDHPSGVLDFRAKSGYSLQVNGYYAIYSPSTAGVKLYHPASQGNILSQKFETTGGGVIITGVATATSFVGALTGNVTGNADTATTLATARNIGGVSFDGSAAINLPGVNAAGNQDTSGTAAIATNVTVADESSDTACFPLFATAATGNLAPKSGTNLTFNSSTGALTATSFVGALTGAVTGNADTATTSTNVTVADESSDTTCFPLFATAATGNLPPKSGTNLTFNSSTGALTATSFAGNISGGTIAGTTATFTGVVESKKVSSSSNDVLIKGTSDNGNSVNVLSDKFVVKADGSATFAQGGSFGNEVYVNGSDTSTQRYLNFSRPTSGQYRATLRRDAWYLGETVTNIGNVTPSGANITLKMNGDATFAGTVSDSIGPLRRLNVAGKSSNFTLTAANAGALLRRTGGNATVPADVFSAGDMITIFNAASSGDMTVLSSAVTLINSADGDAGNTRTIASKGMATIVCTASNEFVISGSQLS